MRSPESVRLEDGPVVAYSTVAGQHIIKEPRLHVVFNVRLVDLGSQHRHMLGKGYDLERFCVKHQRCPKGHQEAPEPAGLWFHRSIVPVAQDNSVRRQPAVAVNQHALADTVIFIGREITASSDRFRNWGRVESPLQAVQPYYNLSKRLQVCFQVQLRLGAGKTGDGC